MTFLKSNKHKMMNNKNLELNCTYFIFVVLL